MIKVLGISFHRWHHYFSPTILSKLEIQTQFCLAELNKNCSFIHMIDDVTEDGAKTSELAFS
ncbi:hypothetical protein MANES_15G059350v8 [Manihot esculenta]|uniref:Uncharacterized protein n=1 Tax=Manihot esculenta TaxID=3983 RepID=A0ACC8CF90_MANES|nr:hypothetical protein MANES_15G059350v8 [Manihot esculenta]